MIKADAEIVLSEIAAKMLKVLELASEAGISLMGLAVKVQKEQDPTCDEEFKDFLLDVADKYGEMLNGLSPILNGLREVASKE